MWQLEIRDLSDEVRVVAPDLRGMGRSGIDPGDGASMRTHAEDVIAWMDALGIERAAVAGLSMGGYIAFELWRRARERIAGLALFDTKADADSEEGKAGRIATKTAIAHGGMEAVAEGMLSRVLGPTTRATKPAVVDHVRRMILGTKPEGAIAAAEALRTRPSSARNLGEIDVPVIVVVGEDDELTPPAVSQEMAARISGAELRIVPGAGHVSSLEAPAEVTRALRDLVRRAFPEHGERRAVR
jgi:pimeloyl-ACP methyl ester carboxylesterase